MSNKEGISGEEIKKEFQLERMILFSDAVFAIVITLMAIEIKIPETSEKLNSVTLPHELYHLLPVLSAYIVSFLFIGVIWYQHLKIFSIVKDYDKGLVIRNLLLLFFIGLFPFCVSVVTRSKSTPLAFFIYLGAIVCCIISQYILYDYIVIRHPLLRHHANLDHHLFELKKRKFLVLGFSIVYVVLLTAYYLIPENQIMSLASLLLLPFVIIYRFFFRKKKPAAIKA